MTRNSCLWLDRPPISTVIEAGRPRRCHHRAFTLVELLVVIGIIALLISILLPTLNRARESANTVTCASQLRQVGTLMAMYVSQSNGWLVPTNYASGGTWESILISSTLGDSYQVQMQKYFINPSVITQGYINDQAYKFFYCPTSAGRGFIGRNPTFGGYFTNYVANFSILPTPGSTLPEPMKVSRISKTSETFLAADAMPLPHLGIATRAPAARQTYQLRSGDPNNYAAYIHSGKEARAAQGGICNFLFVDGHVSGIRDPGAGNMPITGYQRTGLPWLYE